MSLRPNTVITIEQQANSAIPNRVLKTFTLDFVHSGEINSTWQNLTDTAKLKFPRNVYVDNGTPSPDNWTGQVIYNNDVNPLFMRGDKITIELGYFYDNMNGQDETLVMDTRFIGFITKIKNRMPIEIECEDMMWKLKQIKCPNKLFPGSTYTVQSMITELLQGTGIVVRDGVDGSIQTNIGDFRTQNETVAQVLERLRKDGGLYSYFRGNELRCSGIVYYPQDRNDEVFEFQNNIISDNLEYTRKEDLDIAIKAHAQTLANGSGSNKDGSPKTKRKRLEVLVGKNGVIPKDLEKTFHGDLITIPVLGATTEQQLIDAATKLLPKFYYTGFKGSITTFGQPFVRHGDGGIIRDKVIPECDGTYLIKQVTTDFGMQGFRQKILLHLRIDKGYTQEQLNQGI